MDIGMDGCHTVLCTGRNISVSACSVFASNWWKYSKNQTTFAVIFVYVKIMMKIMSLKKLCAFFSCSHWQELQQWRRLTDLKKPMLDLDLWHRLKSQEYFSLLSMGITYRDREKTTSPQLRMTTGLWHSRHVPHQKPSLKKLKPSENANRTLRLIFHYT